MTSWRSGAPALSALPASFRRACLRHTFHHPHDTLTTPSRHPHDTPLARLPACLPARPDIWSASKKGSKPKQQGISISIIFAAFAKAQAQRMGEKLRQEEGGYAARKKGATLDSERSVQKYVMTKDQRVMAQGRASTKGARQEQRAEERCAASCHPRARDAPVTLSGIGGMLWLGSPRARHSPLSHARPLLPLRHAGPRL